MSRTIVIATLAALLALPTSAGAGEWLAGDLHVHTTYSHDSYGGPGDDNTGPDEFYTLGWSVREQFTIAKLRGLDYLAISDHNDVRSQSDTGFGAAGVIPLPAYENSLEGHAQMLGARKLYDSGDESAAAVNAMAAALRADGGLLQANHPSDPTWGYGPEVPLDAIEVWNLPRVYQPPLPSSSDNDAAIRLWESRLDGGERIAATGGSDSHWRSTAAAQGAGQPTTYVFSEGRTAEGILDGLRKGRSFISHQPPGLLGPKLFLEADADGDGRYESLVGDTVPAGSPARVRVIGAPGAFVSVIGTGGRQLKTPVAVTSAAFEHRFRAPEDAGWIRAEVLGQDLREQRVSLCEGLLGARTTYCRNQILALAMTSALYLATP